MTSEGASIVGAIVLTLYLGAAYIVTGEIMEVVRRRFYRRPLSCLLVMWAVVLAVAAGAFWLLSPLFPVIEGG